MIAIYFILKVIFNLMPKKKNGDGNDDNSNDYIKVHFLSIKVGFIIITDFFNFRRCFENRVEFLSQNTMSHNSASCQIVLLKKSGLINKVRIL
jgi:hypothetical protein